MYSPVIRILGRCTKDLCTTKGIFNNIITVMNKVTPFLLFLFLFLTVNRPIVAQNNDRPEITPVLNAMLSQPGMDSTAVNSFVMELKPGFTNRNAHHHNGDMFGYVIEGSIEMTMEEGEPVVYQAGEMFHERHREQHRAYRNPSNDTAARVLMIRISNPPE